MGDSISDCCEQTVSLPLNIFVPIRGNGTTVHADDSPKALVGFVLPKDLLMQNVLITLTGKHTSGSIRLAFQIHAMLTRVDADSPNTYKAEVAAIQAMADDPDIEVSVVANGDAGINITVTDTSADAGTINWNFQIWVLDEITL